MYDSHVRHVSTFLCPLRPIDTSKLALAALVIPACGRWPNRPPFAERLVAIDTSDSGARCKWTSHNTRKMLPLLFEAMSSLAGIGRANGRNIFIPIVPSPSARTAERQRAGGRESTRLASCSAACSYMCVRDVPSSSDDTFEN